jgi:hypothetical protein
MSASRPAASPRLASIWDLADTEIDARGKLVLPGGIDSHVHIAQPSGPDIVQADDFESGTRSAAFGGNTTVIPFCLQESGQGLRQAIKDYHAKADGQCFTDYGFHLIVSDPTPTVLGQELPAAIGDGYSSFKVFMTYEGLALTDEEILKVMAVARGHRRAGDGARGKLRHHPFPDREAGVRGQHRAAFSRHVAPHSRRARGHASRLHAGGDRRCAAGDRACLQRRGDRGNPACARPRRESPVGDLSAIPDADREGSRRPEHGGRQIRLQPAAARQAQSGRVLGWDRAGNFDFYSSDHCPFRYNDEKASWCRRAAPVSAGCRTEFRVWRRGCRSCSRKAS